MAKKYKVEVNKDDCIGCGACVAACSQNFDINKDGKAIPLNEEITDKELDCNKDAEEVCPVSAIKITEI